MNNSNSFVSLETIADVDCYHEEFNTNILSQSIQNVLVCEANAHSEIMELPYKERKIAAKKMLDQQERIHSTLCGAWQWGIANYNGELNHTFLEELARRIEPENEAVKYGFRQENVRITGHDVVLPPRHEKIITQLEEMYAVVNESPLHTLDRAFYAHLHLARIHPFEDGNGRLSRIVQNLILNQDKYAPALIRNGERTFYQNTLRQAMRGYQERINQGKPEDLITFPFRITTAEKMLFDYLGTKVIAGFESGIDKINNLPQYQITFRNLEPGQLYTAKNIISHALTRKGGPVLVHVNEDDLSLKITASTTDQVLRQILLKIKSIPHTHEIRNLRKTIKLKDEDT
jgi:hypothetical protein